MDNPDLNVQQGQQNEPGEPNNQANTPPAGQPSDLEIENAALKELLAENKKTIDELNKTMAEVKQTNAKLLNQMDVGHKADVSSLMNEMFNKYAKQI